MPFEPAARLAGFGQSIFTTITELAALHRAIDLSTGFPDNDGPDAIKAAAQRAIQDGPNQYTLAHGLRELRQAAARHIEHWHGQRFDPETEITITHGATEALHSGLAGLLNPGDEVIVFEPFYEIYPPNVVMAGGVPRYVPLRPPDWSFDPDELRAAFNGRTRAILVNTPHNPTGKVFSPAELGLIAALCQQWDCVGISDEVYEHLVYTGATHTRLAQVPGMAERTLTLSSLSKTFSFTGWRIGWAAAPPDLTGALRLAHQFVLDSSAAPLQAAAVAALALDDEYYHTLAAGYAAKRDFLAAALQAAGFEAPRPAAGFFILAGFGQHEFADDFAACRRLAAEAGIAAIPPSAFFTPAHKHLGQRHVRFAFCKTLPLLEQAAERLRKFSDQITLKSLNGPQ